MLARPVRLRIQICDRRQGGIGDAFAAVPVVVERFHRGDNHMIMRQRIFFGDMPRGAGQSSWSFTFKATESLHPPRGAATAGWVSTWVGSLNPPRDYRPLRAIEPSDR